MQQEFFHINESIILADFTPVIVKKIDENGNVFAEPFDFQKKNDTIFLENSETGTKEFKDGVNSTQIEPAKDFKFAPPYLDWLIHNVRFFISKAIRKPLPYRHRYLIEEYSQQIKNEYETKLKTEKINRDKIYLEEKKDLVKWFETISKKYDFMQINILQRFWFDKLVLEFGNKYSRSEMITVFNKMTEYNTLKLK